MCRRVFIAKMYVNRIESILNKFNVNTVLKRDFLALAIFNFERISTLIFHINFRKIVIA